MKKILDGGHYISPVDKLALENDLNVPLEEWILAGCKSMVTHKPVKQLLKEEMPKLKAKKAKEGKNLSADCATCINEICSCETFKPRKYEGSDLKKPTRKVSCDIHILPTGFDVEDHEHTAACSYWLDPTGLVRNLIDNKIARCRERFVKEWEAKLMADPLVTEIPSNEDDLIMMVVARPDYKNRVQKEALEQLEV